MTRCDKCRKPATSLEPVVIQTARQTHWSPAEHEEQDWCDSCRDAAEYEASMDDFDRDYERARANGWAD
jgi:hypothetical protein